MANYLNGKPLSGLNSIPRLTLAQYNALNVKPEFWVRTDAPESYKKLSADQVSYDSNNTVKDALDIVTAGNMGNGLNILPYNTSSNMYTVPYDGYIVLQVWSSESIIDFWIGKSTLKIELRFATMKQFALFARKGTSYWFDGSGNNRSAFFCPLVI